MTQVIVRDRFDAADWDAAQAIPAVASAVATIGRVDERGPALLADLYSALLRSVPSLLDAHGEWQVNRQIMEATLASPRYTRLRAVTVADTALSACAVAAMAPELARLYRASWRALPADLTDATDYAFQATIDGTTDAALGDATDATVLVTRAERTWGLADHDATTVDPARRLALAEQLNGPLATITGHLATLRAAAGGAPGRRRSIPRGVALSGDVNRLIAAELVNLADPDLEPEFLDRLTRRQALTIDVHSGVPERGRFVYVEDSSGTVNDEGYSDWLRALGVALALEAHKHGRDFCGIVFSGPDSQVVHDLPVGAPIEKLLAYAATELTGGTAYQPALTLALEHLDEHGDLVLATDGDFDERPSADWLTGWLDQHGDRRFYGVLIGCDDAPGVSLLVDHVTTIHTLTNPAARLDRIFTATQEAA